MSQVMTNFESLLGGGFINTAQLFLPYLAAFSHSTLVACVVSQTTANIQHAANTHRQHLSSELNAYGAYYCEMLDL